MRYIDELLRNMVAELRLWAGRRLGGWVATRSVDARGVPAVGLGLVRPVRDHVGTTGHAQRRVPSGAADRAVAPELAGDR
jgi:hypothetical protein